MKVAIENIFLTVALILLNYSCRKDQPPEIVQQPIVNNGNGKGVFIANEGTFPYDLASVSYLDFGSGNIIEDLFFQSNNYDLGSVCQSLNVYNNRAYITVNNSGKIEVCDPNTLQKIATISGFISPRYLLPINNSKAYVSDLYSNSISIVDLNNNQIIGSIACPAGSEQMAEIYGKVYVTNLNTDYLYIINTLTDAITDSINIGKGGNSIVEDKNAKLWISCSSIDTDNLGGSIVKINPATDQIELSLPFSDTEATPWRLCLNPSKDTLYFLNKNIYRMAINESMLPTSIFIPNEDRSFYGLGIDPNSGSIYIADAIDYIQRGRIYRYTPNGEPIDNFLAGIIPGSFYFW